MNCSVKECTNPVKGRGYCNKHYSQILKYGKISTITQKDFNKIVKKKAYYELILTNIKMEEVGRCKIDKEDLDKVRAVGRWSLDKDGYVVNGKNARIFMHRLIMNASKHEYVDHKKVGIKYKRDNRKSNLRICTSSQNNSNKKISSKNTSGFKGVSFHRTKNKFIAGIKINGKRIHLGYFNTAKEASKAYERAASEIHGEFRCIS